MVLQVRGFLTDILFLHPIRQRNIIIVFDLAIKVVVGIVDPVVARVQIAHLTQCHLH